MGNCNGCKVVTDFEPNPPSLGNGPFNADGCEMYAHEHKMPFSTQGHSNGAPAGCIRYDDGSVIFVETCKNHENCGTDHCNGCKVVQGGSLSSHIPGNRAECYLYSLAHKMPFSTQGHSNGAPAGCMRYDDGRVIFVESCRNHPNCGTMNCNGCKVVTDFEPSPPSLGNGPMTA